MRADEILKQQDRKREQQKQDAAELKQMQAAQLKRELVEVKAACEELENENRILRQVSFVEAEPIAIPVPKDGGAGDLTALVVVSDNHAFEVVKKQEVNGLNEHNAKICGERLAKLFQKVVQLVGIERRAANVRHLVLGLIGDHMTNQMHMDQIETNDGTPMEEVLFLFEQFTGGINYLLEHGGFDSISVPCEDGNHGRHTIKQQHANRAKHSYEWLLFQMLAKHYANEPRVKFDIAEGQLLYTEIYGRTVRWTHGDAIKYNGGIGGLTIPAKKAINEWDKGKHADFTIFGHYHTSHLDKSFLSNGCSIGYGPYSVRIKAPYEPPSQSLLFISPKHFLSSYRPIYL